MSGDQKFALWMALVFAIFGIASGAVAQYRIDALDARLEAVETKGGTP